MNPLFYALALALLPPAHPAFALAAEGRTIDALPREARCVAARRGEDAARLIERLGCRQFSCRDAALRDVRALGPAAAAVLAWARRSADPHVRHEAEGLIAEMFGGDDDEPRPREVPW